MRKAIFIDKDGTLIENVAWNVDPEKISLMPGADVAMRLLYDHGFALVVISNQAGIAYGYCSEHDMLTVAEKIEELLQVPLDGFYYCPHHPEGTVEVYAVECDCRKPAPGMLLKAAAALNIDLRQSWMLGDILNDVEAGNRAGCRSMLINNGNETEWVLDKERLPFHAADNLLEAACFILDNTNNHQKR